LGEILSFHQRIQFIVLADLQQLIESPRTALKNQLTSMLYMTNSLQHEQKNVEMGVFRNVLLKYVE
jgi:hypothetical protein